MHGQKDEEKEWRFNGLNRLYVCGWQDSGTKCTSGRTD